MRSRISQLLDKSIAAAVAAIEVYNKPDFRYREEIFSILIVNAWELLFKAKWIEVNGGKLSSIYVYENKKDRNGSPTKKRVVKTNRAGNPMTHSLEYLQAKLDENPATRLDPKLKKNLTCIVELRDNAIHFFNKGFCFTLQVQELGSAALQNFVNLIRAWFDRDLSKFNFYLMPLSFVSGPSMSEATIVNGEERQFMSFVSSLNGGTSGDDEIGPYNVSINISVQFVKASTSGAVPVEVVKPGTGATQVELTEEQVRKNYPWTYEDLCTRLKSRYRDFKVVQRFHNLRNAIQGNPKFVNRRYLDPGNPKSGKKDFYSSNILNYFDQHYTKV